MIRVVHHTNIDTKKWDACIESCSYAPVYAQRWFLTQTAPHWKAIIYGDYEYVFALPVKKKFGLSYIVQPPYCQKLDVYSSLPLTKEVQELFVKEISKYWSIRICTQQALFSAPYHTVEQANYVLNLQQDYSYVFQHFSTNCKRNIKKTQNLGVEVASISSEEFQAFLHKNLTIAMPAEYYTSIQGIVLQGVAHKQLELFGAFVQGELCAVAGIFVWQKKVYYSLACSNELGKNSFAMFAIVNYCIARYASNALFLDFDGSEVPGIAKFYASFGAKLQPYYASQKHALAFVQKIIK